MDGVAMEGPLPPLTKIVDDVEGVPLVPADAPREDSETLPEVRQRSV